MNDNGLDFLDIASSAFIFGTAGFGLKSLAEDTEELLNLFLVDKEETPLEKDCKRLLEDEF